MECATSLSSPIWLASPKRWANWHARVMARRYGDQSFKAGEKPNLGEEMADVLWVLICLANQTGIDLTAELEKSFEKKTRRDATRHINNSKL